MTMFGRDDGAVPAAQWPQVLTRYAATIRPIRVRSLGNRGGFSGAAIWQVTTEQGDFALRRWPSRGLPRERILGLHRLLEHLKRQQIDFVAVPVVSGLGETLVTDSGSEWQLEPWMPGEANFRNNPSAPRLAAAMQALARWQRAAEQYVPQASSAKWFQGATSAPSPAVCERLQTLSQIDEATLRGVAVAISQCQQAGLRDLTQQVLGLIQRGRAQALRELQGVRDLAVRLQPCLRDVWHDHLLFVGDDVTGLIDPSACRIDNVACDLARLLGSLVGDDRQQWGAALGEYQRYRQLSVSELRLIDVLDHSGVLLSGWTWLQWIYVEGRSFADWTVVERRLREIQQRLLNLVIPA